MEKYKMAIRRALHQFNYSKRMHYIPGARVATGFMDGIISVATYDSEVSSKDFLKMQNLHRAMFNKTFEM